MPDYLSFFRIKDKKKTEKDKREREREREREEEEERSILCRRQRRNVNMQVAKSLKGNVRGPALLSSRARNARTTSVSTPSVGHSVLHTAYLGKQRGPTRANASSVKAESGAGAGAGAGAGVTVDGDVGLAAKRRGKNNGTERKKKKKQKTHTQREREREREEVHMAVQFFNSLCSFLSNAFYSLSSPFRCINQLPSPPFFRFDTALERWFHFEGSAGTFARG